MASFPGVGEFVRDLDEFIEGAGDLARREGGEAGSPHVVNKFRVCFEDEGEGFDADEFAFAVVVGCDDDAVGLFGERDYGVRHTLLGYGLQDLRVDEARRFDLLPVRVLLRVLGIEDVSFEADGHRLLAFPRESMVRHAAVLPLLHLAFGEELRDLLGCVRFLRNN